MKKTLLLTLCILALIALTAFSAGAADPALPEVCPHCQVAVEWTPITAHAKNVSDGHYYLAFDGDTLECGAFNIDGKVCLHMNSKTLIGSNRIFYINDTLTLMGEGTATGNAYSGANGYGGSVYVNGGTFNLYDTTITTLGNEGRSTERGGVVYATDNSLINIYSGAVIGGHSTAGGTLYLRKSACTIYGGTVGGGTATGNGGSVVLSTGATLDVRGGTITGGTSGGTGGTMIIASDSKVILSGGTVENGTATSNGPCVYFNSGTTLELSGDATAASLQFESLAAKPITVTGAYTGSFTLMGSAKHLVDGYVVGVSNNADLSMADITVDAEDMNLCVRGETLRISAIGDIEPTRYIDKYCPVCGVDASWICLDEKMLANNTRLYAGHYIVDIPGESSYMRTKNTYSNQRVCFDMNGKTLTCDRAFAIRGTFNIMDSVGGGKVIGKGPNSTGTNYGGVVYVYAGYEVNLYSGTLAYERPTDGRSNITYGGVVYAVGTFNMYGGTVTGGGAKNGGNIFGNATADDVSEIGLYGGVVDEGITIPDFSSIGKSVLIRGTVTLGGDCQVDNIRFSSATGYSPPYNTRMNILPDFTGTASITTGSFNTCYPLGYAATTAGITYTNSKTAQLLIVDGRFIPTAADCKVVTIAESGSAAAYTSLAAAAAAATTTDRVILLQDITEDTAINNLVFLDLNGYHITGTLTGTGTLVCMDNATDDLTVADGVYGRITGKVTCALAGATPATPQAKDNYLMLTSADGISFHRVQLQITNSALRPSCAGIYYQAEFKGDELVTDLIFQVGVALNAAEVPTIHNLETTSIYTAQAADDSGFSALLSGIMKTENTEEINSANATTQVYAAAYAKLSDGTVLVGHVVATDIQSQASHIEDVWYYLSTPQKRAYMAMFRTYRSVMSAEGWNTATAVTNADLLDRYDNDDLTPYLIPWQEDVVAKAKADGQLHYYFISTEGMICSATSKYPTKSGDCCLVVFPNGQTMLIDSGYMYTAKLLVANLQRLGISHLDYILITHPHADHQNGIFHEASLMASGFMETFTIGQVIYRGGTDPDSFGAIRVPVACEEFGIPYRTFSRGDVLMVGDVKLTCIWPVAGVGNVQVTGGVNLNDNSVVVRFDYGEHSALFTGDLYASGEKDVMKWTDPALLDVDLLKVPHHSHNTSSSLDFLEAVSPDYAVAMGYITSPSALITRFNNAGIPLIKDTDYGSIHISAGRDGAMTCVTTRSEPLPDVPPESDDSEELPEEDD